MRYPNRHIVWGEDRLIVIPITSSNKIESARALVESALKGDIGFCYGACETMLLHGYNKWHIKWRDAQREREREQHADQVWKHNKIVAKLKAKWKACEFKDHKAYQQLRSNHDKLQRALALLMDEGEIISYTLDARPVESYRQRGRLTVKWFTGYERETIQVIEQGWTFERGYVTADKTQKQLDWETLNDVALTSGNNIAIGGQQNSSGFKQTANLTSQKVTKGSGELDPIVLMKRDKQAERERAFNRALYVEGAEMRRKAKGQKIKVWA